MVAKGGGCGGGGTVSLSDCVEQSPQATLTGHAVCEGNKHLSGKPLRAEVFVTTTEPPCPDPHEAGLNIAPTSYSEEKSNVVCRAPIKSNSQYRAGHATPLGRRAWPTGTASQPPSSSSAVGPERTAHRTLANSFFCIFLGNLIYMWAYQDRTRLSGL